MQTEEKLKSKSLYKSFVLLLKYIPMLVSICYALNTLAAIFHLDCSVLSHISGMSLFTWIFMYIAATVFCFCIYHKMFLWYILFDDIISLIDYYIDIPINDFQIIEIHCFILCVSLFIILYLYVKHNKSLFRKVNRRYRFWKYKYFRRRRRKDYRNYK